ncbi:glutathione S-transferase family protein [Achromobacter agilis]|uniref:Glutathione S-transferase GST-4.5 n=1 Tax=Achromobacter agilis TaxID=1353888 RepID=A0A446CD55_9BURK|nr:glutathione S-transferase family protein [Achromobacter agilis]SSW65806.1 Glutathione S-transferase GST-4.5 [Achromobacter agilis]
MEPILIYGFPLGSSMGLVAALEWLGKPYRLCRVDMLGEMRLPSYARLNARHETPAFVGEHGMAFSETMAIARWIENRDTERRVSFDPLSPESDRMHQFIAFLNTGFTAAYTPHWVALEMDPPDPAMQKMLREWGAQRIIERHDKLEAMLGDTPFVVGNHPTLADAVLIGVARWLDFHGVADPTRWPRLAALRQRLENDPAVKYATALETGESPSGSGLCKGHVPLDELISAYGK